jgi:methylmalonyl-CoA mutase cobalamin-binding subunit
MRILLMTSFSGVGFNNAPPIGLYRLKHHLELHGFACDVLDLSLDTPEAFIARAAAGDYAVVGMSVSHYHMQADIMLLERFRAATAHLPCLYLAGGQEATYNYEQWLDAGMDAAVLGYGEHPLLAVVQRLIDTSSPDAACLRGIPGVATRIGGETVVTPALPVTHDDFVQLTLTQVLGTHIPYDRYWQQARDGADALNCRSSVFIPELVRIYTSSHCPNRCGFCSSHRFLSAAQGSKAKLCMLDASQVFLLVLHYVRTYGARGFLFSDDEFLVARDRARHFCELVIEAKRNGSLPLETLFNCQARVADFLTSHTADNVDREFMALLHEAGFHSVSLGVESFSERLLATPVMNKTGFTEENVMDIVSAMLETGIIPQVNIILFVPDTTKQEIMHNMHRGMQLIDMGCTTAVTTNLFCIPGAPACGDSNYPHTAIPHHCVASGKTIHISGNFIPRTPDIAAVAEALPKAQEAELATFRARAAWPFEKVHKTMLGIITFIAVARLLGEQDQAEEWCHRLDDFARDLTREAQSGVHGLPEPHSLHP